MAAQGSGGYGGDRGHDDKHPEAGRNEFNEPGTKGLPSLSKIQQTWRTVEPNVHQQGRSTAGPQSSGRLPPIITPPNLSGRGIHESPSHFTSTNGRDIMQPEPQHLFLTPELPVDLSPSRNTANLGRLGPQPLITPTGQLGTDSSLAGSIPRTVSLSQPLFQADYQPAPQVSGHSMLETANSPMALGPMYLPPQRSSPLPFVEAGELARAKYLHPPKKHIFHDTLSDRGWKEPEIWWWWRNNEGLGKATIMDDKKPARTREQEDSETQCAWFGPLPYERLEAYLERAAALGVDNTPDSFYLHHWFSWRERNDLTFRSLSTRHEASVLRRAIRDQKARSEQDREVRELEIVGAEAIDKTPPLQGSGGAALEMGQTSRGLAMYLPPRRNIHLPFLKMEPRLKERFPNLLLLDHPFHTELASRGWIEPETWRLWRAVSRKAHCNVLGNLGSRAQGQELCAIQSSWFGPMPYENLHHYLDRARRLGVDSTPGSFYLRAWWHWREENDSNLAAAKNPETVDIKREAVRKQVRAKQKANASGGVPGAHFGGEHDGREDGDPRSGDGAEEGVPGYGGGDPIPGDSGPR